MTRDTPIPPIPDLDCMDWSGQPVMRCRKCGTIMQLHLEQYCWNCGQRLTGPCDDIYNQENEELFRKWKESRK